MLQVREKGEWVRSAGMKGMPGLTYTWDCKRKVNWGRGEQHKESEPQESKSLRIAHYTGTGRYTGTYLHAH